MQAPVSTFQGPVAEGYSVRMAYDANGNLEYVGRARTKRPLAVAIAITSVSTANPAEFTTTANHGLDNDAEVIIAGATGDWAALNGKRKITKTADTTFTVAVDSTLFAASFDGTVTTFAAQSNANAWSIEKFYYDVSNRQTRSAYAGGSPADDKAWDSRANFVYY